MNHNELTKFIKVVSSIWEACDLMLLEQYYHKSFHASYYGNAVCYDDLVARLKYISLHQKNRKIKILDFFNDNSRIAARFQYSAIDDVDGKINIEILSIYHLNEKDQIIRAWALSDEPVDYHG